MNMMEGITSFNATHFCGWKCIWRDISDKTSPCSEPEVMGFRINTASKFSSTENSRLRQIIDITEVLFHILSIISEAD